MEEVIKLAVIGSPISHSLSPKIHKMFAESLGIDISYEALHVEPVDFKFDQGSAPSGDIVNPPELSPYPPSS